MNGGRAATRLRIAPGVWIPRSELDVRASRASGAGGQHVNKTSTRVEIAWNIETSSVLTDEQRERLRTRLASRLSEEGTVRVVASDTRSQHRNREHAEERLRALVERALIVRKPRRPTKPSRSAIEARLKEKKERSEKKQRRRGTD